MANEAVIIELFGDPKGVPRTRVCADANTFTKGQILSLLDGNIASSASVLFAPCAGICAMDKVSGDGSTTVSCYTQGVFDLYTTSALNIGAPVCLSGANTIAGGPIASALSGATIIGYTEESSAGTEVIRVRVNL